MSKTLTVGLTVMVLAIVFGGFMFFRSGGLKFSSAINEVNKVASPEAISEMTIGISDGSFEPAEIRVLAGGKVTWRNDGVDTHTVTSDKGSFDSREISSGGSFEKVFDRKGTYKYHCKIHPSMEGTVIVE